MAEQYKPVDYNRLMEKINNNDFPPHIAALKVKDKIKRAYTLFEEGNVIQSGGLITTLAATDKPVLKAMTYKERKKLVNVLMTMNLFAFFFGPFYYMFTGMWRKGLAIFGGLALLTGVEMLVYGLLLGNAPDLERSLGIGITIGISILISMMAVYDSYRLKVKKEIFWW